MTTKKTVRVVLAADGVPVVVPLQELDKTRELPAWESCVPDEGKTPGPAHAAPTEIVADDITVPVQSSIESTLTFELLRRQSTLADGDDTDDKGGRDDKDDRDQEKR
jgi:hypothetical protein